jgi:hypothetical protein
MALTPALPRPSQPERAASGGRELAPLFEQASYDYGFQVGWAGPPAFDSA